MGAISRPEFVTCLWPDLTNQKEQHMVKLCVQKWELNLFEKGRLKAAHIFLISLFGINLVPVLGNTDLLWAGRILLVNLPSWNKITTYFRTHNLILNLYQELGISIRHQLHVLTVLI